MTLEQAIAFVHRRATVARALYVYNDELIGTANPDRVDIMHSIKDHFVYKELFS